MPLLEMKDIVKEFPGVRALDGVSLTLEPGEFLSLVGENGAGKSTLMKVLSGVYPAGTYEGEILIEGEEAHFRGIRDSEEKGIAIIFQELSLVKEMTVGENIFLGQAPAKLGVVNWSELYHRASRLLSDLNLNIDPRVEVGSLGIGRQQLVEIAKALSKNAKILVLDEPTAALTESEVETLFEILRNLTAKGVGVIYISHKLDEVFEMSDRITVLRDGRSVRTENAADITKDEVIAAMVGRQVGDIFPTRRHELGEVALSVVNLTATDADTGRKLVDNISFKVRKGEVLGIAGLMGSGRSELLMSIFGAFPGRVSGVVEIEGRRTDIVSPSQAIRNGIGFVTEDRKRYGLVLDQSIRNNMVLAGLKRVSGRFLTNLSRESAAVRGPMNSLRIKAPSAETITGTLSGGNQQKVVFGKWMQTDARILLLDEPTRGIDVGAKQELYGEINKMAENGLAVVLVSSELPEVLGLSDRVIVLHEGRFAGEFSREQATPERVMAAATGNQ
jgi:D-xylose transport system ATP-binding protein